MVTVLLELLGMGVAIIGIPFLVYISARLAAYGFLDGKRSYEQNLGERKHEDEASKGTK